MRNQVLIFYMYVIFYTDIDIFIFYFLLTIYFFTHEICIQNCTLQEAIPFYISYLKIALFLFYLTANSGLLNLKLVAYLIVQITTTALVGSITTGFITLLTAIIRRTFTIVEVMIIKDIAPPIAI